MKKSLLRLLIATLAILLLVVSVPPVTAQEPVNDGTYAPGEVVIKLRSAADLNAVAQRFNLEQPPLDQFGSRPIFRMKIGDMSSPEEKAAALTADQRIRFAEPNYLGETPESRRRSRWTIGGDSGSYLAQWAPASIQLAAAHKVTRGANVRVAVIDTGVDRSHPALAGKLGPGFDFVDFDDDPSEVGNATNGGFGHGTHVAGIVALVAPQATITPIRALDKEGVGNIWVLAEALGYAVDPDGNVNTADGAHVINLSVGTTRRTQLLESLIGELTCANDDDDDDTDKSLCDASGRRGVVVVAAGGNDSASTPQYPAGEQVSGLLAVVATNRQERLASFSNYGDWSDIAAPGEYILSTVPGGGYATWSGTSMAAPFVAGAAALVRAADPGMDGIAAAGNVSSNGANACTSNLKRLDVAAALGANKIEPKCTINVMLPTVDYAK